MHLQASLPYLIGPRHSHLSSQFPVWCLSLTSHHTHKETDWLWVWVGVGVGVGCFHYFLFGVVSPSQIPFVSLLKRQVRAEQPKVWVHVSTAWNGCCDIGPVHSDTGYTYTSKEKKKVYFWFDWAVPISEFPFISTIPIKFEDSSCNNILDGHTRLQVSFVFPDLSSSCQTYCHCWFRFSWEANIHCFRP